MRIQNYYRKLKRGMVYKRFLTKKLPYAEYIQGQLQEMWEADSCPDDADFCIITVAFNNLQYLKWQNELLERFDRNKHSQIIIDNSTDPAASGKIREFCRERHILWIRIPENPFSSAQFLSPSTSHAAAVNYAMMPYHSTQVVYQLYDGTWLHFFNGSNWDNKKEQVESKTALMSEMMKLIHNDEEPLKDAKLAERNPDAKNGVLHY